MRRPEDDDDEDDDDDDDDDDGKCLSPRSSAFCGKPKKDANQGTKGPIQWPLDDDDEEDNEEDDDDDEDDDEAEEDEECFLFDSPSSR